MKAKTLHISNFRNIESAEITLSPDVNILYGNNAQGKTNALEAIYYFARGRSFRTSRDLDLIRFGEKEFRISLTFEDREREKTLSCRIGSHIRERKKNGVKLDRVGDMVGEFRAVLFCPEHLSLVKGGPEERRSFLNIALSQCYPTYISIYAAYQKVLEHRNALLKMAQKGFPIDLDEIGVFSEKLAGLSSDIYRYRTQYISLLSEYAEDILYSLSDEREKLSLSYDSDIEEGEDPKEIYQKKLKQNLQKEVAAGYTLYGVHRDDLGIVINGRSARLFASQGQQRSIVLTLKTAEGEASRHITGEYPVFLFDDVLSELDEKRRLFVLRHTEDKQLILTSCYGLDEEENANRIEVEGGKYASAHRKR